MTTLDISGLNVSYGQIHALRGLDLKVDSGEVFCLVGANGAGKSTALKGVMGLASASGQVQVEGADLSRMPSHKRIRAGLALVPEGRHVFPYMTVEENLLTGCRGESHQVARQRLQEVVELFPRVGERLDQQAGTMSGGEQQMVAIGRALMTAPKVLLMDEPTLGLAPVMVDRVSEALQTLRGRGLAIVLAEQNLTMALSVADRGLVLENGVVSVVGTAASLKEDKSVQAAYLGS